MSTYPRPDYHPYHKSYNLKDQNTPVDCETCKEIIDCLNKLQTHNCVHYYSTKNLGIHTRDDLIEEIEIYTRIESKYGYPCTLCEEVSRYWLFHDSSNHHEGAYRYPVCWDCIKQFNLDFFIPDNQRWPEDCLMTKSAVE